MINNKKQKTDRASNSIQNTLITCAVIMLAYYLFVAVATQGSLSYYATPHGVLGLIAALTAFFINRIPMPLVILTVVISVIGAISAVGIFIVYLPYYNQHLQFTNSIK